MLSIKKVEKITLLHDYFKTPSIARIANRLVFHRYSDKDQEYIFVVNKDRSTDVLPLRQGFEMSLLNKDALQYLYIKNSYKVLKSDVISYEEARKKIFLRPLVSFPLKPSLFGNLKEISRIRAMDKSNQS